MVCTLLNQWITHESEVINQVCHCIHCKPETYDEPMYCQSNETFRKPKPSLPFVPPNKLVKTSTTLEEALCDARQNTLIPLSSGKM